MSEYTQEELEEIYNTPVCPGHERSVAKQLIATMKETTRLKEQLEVCTLVLNKYAYEDYRGNKPQHITDCQEALERIKDIHGGKNE